MALSSCNKQKLMYLSVLRKMTLFMTFGICEILSILYPTSNDFIDFRIFFIFSGNVKLRKYTGRMIILGKKSECLRFPRICSDDAYYPQLSIYPTFCSLKKKESSRLKNANCDLKAISIYR